MIKNSDYDFDTIISSEDFERNRDKMIYQEKQKKKKYKLKRWVRNVLWVLLGALIGISIYQFITIKTINNTSLGNYECHGGIVQVCSGSSKVAKYLGA